MPSKVTDTIPVQGLSIDQVPLLRKRYGRNIFRSEIGNPFFQIIKDILREPMFLMLVTASIIYFFLGRNEEGIMMTVAIALVTLISIYQEAKSEKAIKALNQFTQPKVMVIRDAMAQELPVEELVPGDIVQLEEGARVPADAIILQANDLTVDESIITGESLPIEKNEQDGKNILLQGCTINSGKCIARIQAIGNNTVLGKIGKEVSGYHSPKSGLQLQTNRFVRKLAFFGLAGFLIIFIVNYFHDRNFATSLLFALTLAMSAIPEEIPVAFSSFMALGAFKLSKSGIISRNPQVIENLGAVTVLCLDKTGTITENKMQVKLIYDPANDSIWQAGEKTGSVEKILFYAALASEHNPFDSMEKAIWQAYLEENGKEHEQMKMIYEYPLEGRPPMMTHVYKRNDNIIAAGKGGVERIMSVCRIDDSMKKKLLEKVQQFSSSGYRVLGVASAPFTGKEFPSTQDQFNWHFEGLLALYDPPKMNMDITLKKIYAANIDVKLVTGDYPETALSIAKQVGINCTTGYYTGEEIMNMEPEKLMREAKNSNIFARMFPEAKLKLIQALKSNGEVVIMTGDGVNDGPALKAADIGIAMGQKGTEIARLASDLILTDDKLEKILPAVSEGRKIYNNFLKAIRYIISIHIPIILTASLPLILGWKYPNIFTPIHVIFLELIMGPTCSIFFEKEPMEDAKGMKAPRNKQSGLFATREFLISIVQGLVITAGILSIYYFSIIRGDSLEETRNNVFTTLVLSNLFLTFANRSFTKTIFHTWRYKNNLAPVIIIISVIFLVGLHYIPAVWTLFGLAPISAAGFWLCCSTAFGSVMWFEVYKLTFISSRTTST